MAVSVQALINAISIRNDLINVIEESMEKYRKNIQESEERLSQISGEKKK